MLDRTGLISGLNLDRRRCGAEVESKETQVLSLISTYHGARGVRSLR